MKVGILTITHGQNYGNRLQNYAVQEVLKKLGHEPETIRNTTKTFNTRTFNYRMKLLIKRVTKYKYENIDKRRYKCDKFTFKYIKQSRFTIAKDEVPGGIADAYDMFLSGSDQVWNPQYGCNSEIDFMTFAPQNKRMSYAASFGVSQLPEENKREYREWLNGIKYLSIREDSGRQIIHDLTGREAEVLIDPTMMLEQKEWEKIEKRPDWINIEKDFVLTYFLGEPNLARDQYVKKVAGKYGCQVISLYNDMTENEEERNNISFIADPAEFIWLIHNSKIVLTDSFHACVFSILFRKNFRVFKRYIDGKAQLGSRIDTLLGKFGLQEKKVDYQETIMLEENTAYEDAYEVLERERKKVYTYLKKALS